MQSNVVWAYFFLITIFAHNADESDKNLVMRFLCYHLSDIYICGMMPCMWQNTYLAQYRLRMPLKSLWPSWRAQKGEGEGEGRLLHRLQSIPKWPPPPPPPPPSPPGHLSTVFHGTGGYSTTCSTRRLCPPGPGLAPDPGETLFSLVLFVGLYSLGELASMLQGFSRDTQLRFPPKYIQNAF